MNTKHYNYKIITELFAEDLDRTIVMDVPLEEVVAHYIETSNKFVGLRDLDVKLIDCDLLAREDVR